MSELTFRLMLLKVTPKSPWIVNLSEEDYCIFKLMVLYTYFKRLEIEFSRCRPNSHLVLSSFIIARDFEVCYVEIISLATFNKSVKSFDI